MDLSTFLNSLFMWFHKLKNMIQIQLLLSTLARRQDTGETSPRLNFAIVLLHRPSCKREKV